MVLHSLALVMLLPVQTPSLSSVAIFNLETRTGVAPDVGAVLTGQVVALTRQRSTFSRVISASEVEAALGLERQKQLLDCDSTSCMTEIAGSLNVSHILLGTVGRLGGSVLLDLRVVAVRTQFVAASVTRRVTAGKADALLDVLPGALDELLGLAGVLKPPPPAPLWPKALLGVGAATAGGTGLALVASVLGAGAAGTFFAALYGLVPLDVRGVAFPARMGILGVLGAGAGVMLLLTVVGAVVTLGVLGGGAFGMVQP